MNVTKYNRLLKSTTSFQDFEDKIASYTNKEKGDIFNFKKIYLYDDIPNKLLDELKFQSNDKGIDLLVVTKDDKYIPIQCKYIKMVIFSFNQSNTYSKRIYTIYSIRRGSQLTPFVKN